MGAQGKIPMPIEVEVILFISITESRYKTVDIDNLAKSVLDALNTVAFDDDSQVTSLICKKMMFKENGILIGITKLTSNKIGFQQYISLFTEVEK